jgi:hypothetical protein
MSRFEEIVPEADFPAWELPDGGSDHLVLGQLTGRGTVAPGVCVDRRKVNCRRSRSLRSLIQGNSNPRRRLSRRHGDHNLLLLDYYDPKMLYLGLSILLLSCTDALFTLNLLALGAEEMNFFMKALLDRSVASFLGIKIGLTGVSVVLLIVVSQRLFMGWFRVVRVMQGICVGYVALIAYEIYLLASVANG